MQPLDLVVARPTQKLNVRKCFRPLVPDASLAKTDFFASCAPRVAARKVRKMEPDRHTSRERPEQMLADECLFLFSMPLAFHSSSHEF
jgi:hypothetical protein